MQGVFTNHYCDWETQVKMNPLWNCALTKLKQQTKPCIPFLKGHSNFPLVRSTIIKTFLICFGTLQRAPQQKHRAPLAIAACAVGYFEACTHMYPQYTEVLKLIIIVYQIHTNTQYLRKNIPQNGFVPFQQPLSDWHLDLVGVSEVCPAPWVLPVAHSRLMDQLLLKSI